MVEVLPNMRHQPSSFRQVAVPDFLCEALVRGHIFLGRSQKVSTSRVEFTGSLAVAQVLLKDHFRVAKSDDA